MKIKNSLINSILVIVIFSCGGKKQNSIEHSFVRDYAAVFTSDQVARLEYSLKEYEKESSCQVFLITTNSTDGTTSSDYSRELMSRLKPGRAGLNNGALFLIVVDDKKLELRLSLGFEVLIGKTQSDSLVNLMIDQFKTKDIYHGSKMGIEGMIDLSRVIDWRIYDSPTAAHTRDRYVQRIKVRSVRTRNQDKMLVEDENGKVTSLTFIKSLESSALKITKGRFVYFIHDGDKPGELVGVSND